MSTIYASFVDAPAAERAAGALLDQGANAEDLSIVANESSHSIHAVNANAKALDAEQGAKSGISTTTPADVAVGAVKGATVGIGVGIAAVLISVFIPGIGIVIGGGALATAMAAGSATILAGAAAGGVVGYLRDQGVPEELVTRYSDDFIQGGAILAVAIPTGSLTPGETEFVLTKYHANNIATVNSDHGLAESLGEGAPTEPLRVDNPRIDPLVRSSEVDEIVEIPDVVTHRIVDAATGESRVVTGPVSVDPVTGLPILLPSATPDETAVVVIETDSGEIVDTGPATGMVIDPVTGIERPANIAEGIEGEAEAPVQAEVVVEKKPEAELY